MNNLFPKIGKGVQISKKIKAAIVLAVFVFFLILFAIVKMTRPNIQSPSDTATIIPNASAQMAKIEMSDTRPSGGLSIVAPANSNGVQPQNVTSNMIALPPGASGAVVGSNGAGAPQGSNSGLFQKYSGVGQGGTTENSYQEAVKSGINSGLSSQGFSANSNPSGNPTTGNNGQSNGTNAQPGNTPTSSSLGGASGDYSSQNGQDQKQAFVSSQPTTSDALTVGVQNPVSKLVISSGSIIPAILETGINSDLPGQITARVRENVFDSITHNNILIPQGSQLIGIYDSSVTYGQSRVLIVWSRVIFPTGQYIDLEGMPGADLSGYSGLNDQVDNHYVRIFGSALLMSLFSAGAQLSQPQNNNNTNAAPTSGQIIAAAMGQNISNVATQMISKNLNIQPTIKIRQGDLFNVLVVRDIPFKQPYLGDNSSVPSQTGY